MTNSELFTIAKLNKLSSSSSNSAKVTKLFRELSGVYVNFNIDASNQGKTSLSVKVAHALKIYKLYKLKVVDKKTLGSSLYTFIPNEINALFLNQNLKQGLTNYLNSNYGHFAKSIIFKHGCILNVEVCKFVDRFAQHGLGTEHTLTNDDHFIHTVENFFLPLFALMKNLDDRSVNKLMQHAIVKFKDEPYIASYEESSSDFVARYIFTGAVSSLPITQAHENDVRQNLLYIDKAKRALNLLNGDVLNAVNESNLKYVKHPKLIDFTFKAKHKFDGFGKSIEFKRLCLKDEIKDVATQMNNCLYSHYLNLNLSGNVVVFIGWVDKDDSKIPLIAVLLKIDDKINDFKVSQIEVNKTLNFDSQQTSTLRLITELTLNSRQHSICDKLEILNKTQSVEVKYSTSDACNYGTIKHVAPISFKTNGSVYSYVELNPFLNGTNSYKKISDNYYLDDIKSISAFLNLSKIVSHFDNYQYDLDTSRKLFSAAMGLITSKIYKYLTKGQVGMDKLIENGVLSAGILRVNGVFQCAVRHSNADLYPAKVYNADNGIYFKENGTYANFETRVYIRPFDFLLQWGNYFMGD